ncbi:glycosyltransferase family 2 protein [Sciscionella sediminilitoris]|uniref:glycosyltransferase family 2 protein n=1 Tax=Sciscionella sediminilitoris TaxID=1445613 RepID=UPI0004DF5507|nr:glycosyltransferase family 2 protein [Sciscionella sp. SE31]
MDSQYRDQYGEELAVVTVTYSPGETLDAMCESVTKATERAVRIIVADNGSTDGAPEKVAAARDNVTLVPTGSNLGYGGGMNRGVAELGPEYGWVVICNADLFFGEGSIDELLTATERWPRGGAFGPLVREVDGSVYPSARLQPSLWRGALHAALGAVWPDNPASRGYRQSDTAVTERTAGWLSGSCMLLRREAFEQIGGFDTRYFMYFEDVDLGDRLTCAGWLNVYVPSAEITHIGGHSTKQASARMVRAHHDSAYRYLADRHQGPRWLPLRLAIKAGLAARAALQIRAER